MFDKAEIGIPCPGCGHKNPKTVAWIKTHDEMVCRGCGESVRIEADELIAGLKKADKAVADFRKSLRSFGKKR